MTTVPLMRVFVNGGVIAPADLLGVLRASEAAGNSYVHLGARQDILFPAAGPSVRAAADVLRESGTPFAPTSLARLRDPWARCNIVSSYAAVNVVDTTWWLTEDVYQYALASFAEQPKLAVSLVDPVQSLVPLFGGQVHFVASTRENVWYVYLATIEPRPLAVRSDDIPGVTKLLEATLLPAPHTPSAELLDAVRDAFSTSDAADDREVTLPRPRFPYYEGLNAMQGDQLWLGVYWRNNRFDVPFLRAACELCRATRIGKVSLTPWKSLVIKGIRPEDRGRWEELTGRWGINLRHSSLELNWHIPVLDDEALDLKNDLVRDLTTRDVSTYGLTFAVASSPRTGTPFTTVAIERDAFSRTGAESWSIRHALDFDSNTRRYVPFAERIPRDALAGRLADLTRRYWSAPATVGAPDRAGETERAKPAAPSSASGYRCEHCQTVYDPAYGDALAGIAPGSALDDLPDGYVCSVCSAPREHLTPLVTA